MGLVDREPQGMNNLERLSFFNATLNTYKKILCVYNDLERNTQGSVLLI